MVILDTCALIEFCKIHPNFSPAIIKKIKKGAYLLSISFAEIACKVKLGKLDMTLSPRDLFSEVSQIEQFEIVDISTLCWLHSIELTWPDNKDPADRLITAFAIQKNLPIVTSDTKIKKFYKKVVW
jgi:PIN domain nuclease of toxin-antitoxin system